MPIVILSDFHPRNILGGGGAIAHEFYQSLLELNVASEFWSTGNPLDDTSEEKFFESRVSKYRIINFFQVCIINRCTLRVIWKLYKKRPNILWVNAIGNRISFSVVLVSRALGIRTFVTLHDFLPINQTKIGLFGSGLYRHLDLSRIIVEKGMHHRLRRKILTFYVNRANGIFAVGPLQCKILKSFGVSVKAWVPNGVANCTHKTTDSKSARKRSGILFAGRFHRKGLEYLIDGLLQSKSRPKLLLAGGMDLFDYAKTRLPEEDIHYFGTVSRQTLHEIIHEVELVCVLSQYFDPYPTIGLEAIRHGALIIATKTSGISHYFTGVGDILINGINQVPDLDKILGNTENFEELNSKIDLQIPQPLEVVKLYLTFFRNK